MVRWNAGALVLSPALSRASSPVARVTLHHHSVPSMARTRGDGLRHWGKGAPVTAGDFIYYKVIYWPRILKASAFWESKRDCYVLTIEHHFYIINYVCDNAYAFLVLLRSSILCCEVHWSWEDHRKKKAAQAKANWCPRGQKVTGGK